MERERILIVEDDVRLAQALDRELGRGYDTVVVHSGRDALFRAETETFDLILLDLNLPDLDGIDVAEQLAGNDADIVMLTARSDVGSRVRGLYAGAADYIPKPFDMHELLARVYARIRARARAHLAAWGPLTLAAGERSAFVDGTPLNLSAQEFQLLALLVGQQGRVFSKATLEERLYHPGEPPASNAIEALVSRLRRKLADAGVRDAIQTIRGLGYVVREAEP
jgi:DNA-binding response OmpR family regulator